MQSIKSTVLSLWQHLHQAAASTVFAVLCCSAAALCPAGTAAAADWDLNSIEAALSKTKIVRADFVQQRELQGFDRPLSSSGHVLYSQHEGILWQQTAPFALTIIIDDSGIVQKSPGTTPQELKAADNPMMHAFSVLLKAMLSADSQALQQFFSLKLTADAQNAENWQLELTPSAAPIDKIFSRIVLTGSDRVENIEMFDLAGDATRIKFSNHDLSSAPLSAEERADFEH